MTIQDQQRFDRAIALFDAANAADPNLDEGQPKELLYAQRMTGMIGRYGAGRQRSRPARRTRPAHQALDGAAQQLSMTKEGYYAGAPGCTSSTPKRRVKLMRQAGYDDAMIDQVKAAVGKRGLKVNADTQMLEDVTDLVFIEYYMLALPASMRLQRGKSGSTSFARPGRKCRSAPTPLPPVRHQAAGAPGAPDTEGDRHLTRSTT